MICPNCGKSFEHDTLVCPICDTPLSNAVYTPISSPSRRKGLLVFLFTITSLIILACGGYYYYQDRMADFESNCIYQTENIFTPESINNMISEDDLKSSLQEMIASGKLSLIMQQDNCPVTAESLINEMNNHASYQIVKVDSKLNQCTVTVECSNLDYQDFINRLSEKLSQELVKDTDQTFWQSFSESVKDILYGKNKKEAEVQDTALQVVKDNYKNLLSTTPYIKHTGKIIFSLPLKQNAEPVLTSFDEKLLSAYLGIELKDAPKINISK